MWSNLNETLVYAFLFPGFSITMFHHYENRKEQRIVTKLSLDTPYVYYIILVDRLSFCLSLLKKKGRRSRKYKKYKGTSYELSHGSSNMMLVFAEL